MKSRILDRILYLFRIYRLTDQDQYALRLSDVYIDCLQKGRSESIPKMLKNVKTNFYLINRNIRKSNFIEQVITSLEKRPVAEEITFNLLLQHFCKFTKSRLISSFWKSRRKGQLVQNAEKIAQGHLSSYLAGHFKESAFIDRELPSGIGYVDISVTHNNIRYLLELKVLGEGEFFGIGQLYEYMLNEGLKEGYLLIFDARKFKKEKMPRERRFNGNLIKVVTIDINPPLPSRKKFAVSTH